MASSNEIPNLRTLGGHRRGGGLRGRAAGRGGGSSHSGEEARDAAVKATDQDAAGSRASCVELGYLHDPSLSRTAAECPGTYVRTTAIDQLVAKFLLADAAAAKQIVSLGAGTDTRFFRLLDLYPDTRLRYHEIDFPANTRAKIANIQRQPLLYRKLLHTPAASTCYHSETYNIHALDLRALAAAPTDALLPEIANLDPTVPTLVLSEMCLVYLPAATVQSIVSALLTRYLAPATPASLVLYEPILPQDAFGRTMISNLRTRNIHLHTLTAYPELGDQRARLRGYGFVAGAEAEDTSYVWRRWVSDEEKARVAGLEFLDELEELELLLRHYCVAWGWRDGESDVFSAAQAFQSSFNLFTGDAEPPPTKREPLRETFRATMRTSQNAPHTVVPADPANEELRAQLNTARYELETARQELEVRKLEHAQQVRDAQNRADADGRRAQQAEAAGALTTKKYDALAKEMGEAQTRAANERQALEKRLRQSQEKAQSLQEECDEAREELSSAQRQGDHRYATLQAEHTALRAAVDEVQADLAFQTAALHSAQKKLGHAEEAAGLLEAEVLRLKAMTGDADTLAVIKRELSDQNTELRQLRKHHKAVETRLRLLDGVQRQLHEAELRKQTLEAERHSWASYLEAEAEAGPDTLGRPQFDSPEDLARAFVQERIERTELLAQLGAIRPELADDKATLHAELQRLKASGAGASDGKARARLERQKALAAREVEFLRAQPGAFDAAKSERISELEQLVDRYRLEIDALQKEFNGRDQQPPSAAAGRKRGLDIGTDSDERVGELRRKNRQLVDDLTALQKKQKMVEAEYRAQHSQLKKLRESSRTRVLELKANPTADAEALKLSTVRHLREANDQLLAQLDGAATPPSTVPTASLDAVRDQLQELRTQLASSEKKIARLKQIWSAKSLEFREAVASILGWRLDFMPNGRVKVTSMFKPADDEGENSIVFDGENGTMKVSGGEQSVFAGEIRDQIVYWVEGRKEIPCFLAALTLEFWEGAQAGTTMMG
ncbi:LCM-domain-containing protein [Ophiobolus disseminans]|uniref:Spindle assembly checkpoint component MAD1 n=1 Tax=Ophiobolus disseminans TaxID=1469910 RepID=A0A6A6ZNS9_9PLEO|nr:LCM-domain-containing protein [Ophiobolus disseminans]